MHGCSLKHTRHETTDLETKEVWSSKEATQNSQLQISQPVAEVLAYLHVQISPISSNVVGSILHVLGKNTDTAIVGYRWTGVGGHHALYI